MHMSMRFLLIAQLYGMVGMIMGMLMGSKSDFTFTPVHSHITLLGWIAISLFGLSYRVFPAMATGRIVKLHFYAANLGIILLSSSLALLLMKNTAALPFLLAGEILTMASLGLFIANIWLHRASA